MGGTVLIHRKLAVVADAALSERERHTRPYLTGVHVARLEDGRTRVEATDGGALVRVTDTAADTRRPTDFPVIEGLAVSENGTAEGIIPADAWRRFFKTASFPKRTFSVPMLQHAALTLEGNQAILAATDLSSPTITRTTTLDGPYPKVDSVFPTEGPVLSFCVDAVLLANILATVAKVVATSRDGKARVRVDIYGPEKPLKITAEDIEDGYTVEALVAPMR